MTVAIATLPIAARDFGCAPVVDGSDSDHEDGPCVTIKNTFITIDGDEGLESWTLQPRGAKSCTARLASGRGRMPDAEEELAVEPAMSDSTPWGESPVARAAELLRQWEPAAQPAATVTLEIPLQVGLGHPLALGLAGDLQVDVSHEDGRVVISLRTASGCTPEVAVAGPPRVSRTPPPAPSSGGSQASPSSTAGDSDDTPAAPSPPATSRAARRTAGARQAGEKSAMVCCHWKNKGWCKYKDTCKFQHPEHKKGAGLMAAAVAATAALAQQQQQLPILPPPGIERAAPAPALAPALPPSIPSPWWGAAGGAPMAPWQSATAVPFA